ncbi:hypothetical protein, partial [Enterobacter hormaechei]|uniref:hypothetical protein n=1 Tax=Enterobacter hormaechei TaxID=158836 RepID=UPI00203FC1A8
MVSLPGLAAATTILRCLQGGMTSAGQIVSSAGPLCVEPSPCSAAVRVVPPPRCSRQPSAGSALQALAEAGWHDVGDNAA